MRTNLIVWFRILCLGQIPRHPNKTKIKLPFEKKNPKKKIWFVLTPKIRVNCLINKLFLIILTIYFQLQIKIESSRKFSNKTNWQLFRITLTHQSYIEFSEISYSRISFKSFSVQKISLK